MLLRFTFLMLKQLTFVIALLSIIIGIRSNVFAEVTEQVFVERVIDGDTVVVKNSKGKVFKIRLLGIQAPELFADPPWAFAKESKNELFNLVNNKKVHIAYNKQAKYDKYGRVLADIYTMNGAWVNGDLVKYGLAYVYILNATSIPKIEELKNLENKAIKEQLPFWQNSVYKVITPLQSWQHISQFKVVDGKVWSVKTTKNSVWLMLTQEGSYGFSLRIKSKDETLFLQKLGITSFTDLQGKLIRVRGFIERYSNKFGPFINLNSPDALDLQVN
ncbi:Endonuclease YhcR [Candidatus Hepatincola sp. Pdp]